MAKTYYWYNFVQKKSGQHVVINSSEVALPKPKIGEMISVSAHGNTVAGTITKVALDLVQDAAGNRTLTYESIIE